MRGVTGLTFIVAGSIFAWLIVTGKFPAPMTGVAQEGEPNLHPPVEPPGRNLGATILGALGGTSS